MINKPATIEMYKGEYDVLVNDMFPEFKALQKDLDETIRDKKDIKTEDWDNMKSFSIMHHIALKNEVNEFINECRDIWKYWKDKAVDKALLIDEFADIIHFISLVDNKNESTSLNTKVFDRAVENIELQSQNSISLEWLDELERSSHINDVLSYASLILIVHYGFTSKDILEAYKSKNKVNYERQENGY